jgi:hypothetical protein
MTMIDSLLAKPKTNPLRSLWEKLPASWPHYFWGLFGGFVLAHTIAMVTTYLDVVTICEEYIDPSPCYLIDSCGFSLLFLYPLLIVLKILFQQFSWRALFKAGIACLFLLSVICLTLFTSLLVGFMVAMAS